ncbi:MAG: hypothetical protein ABSA48_07495 [Terracidiphilus sp.]|jgi:hypothetical protein
MRTKVIQDEATGMWYWWWQNLPEPGTREGPFDTREEAESRRKAFEKADEPRRAKYLEDLQSE